MPGAVTPEALAEGMWINFRWSDAYSLTSRFGLPGNRARRSETAATDDNFRGINALGGPQRTNERREPAGDGLRRGSWRNAGRRSTRPRSGPRHPRASARGFRGRTRDDQEEAGSGQRHGVLLEKPERHDRERLLVRRLEHHRRRAAGLRRLQPAARAQAPAVAGHEPGKAPLRLRRD